MKFGRCSLRPRPANYHGMRKMPPQNRAARFCVSFSVSLGLFFGLGEGGVGGADSVFAAPLFNRAQTQGLPPLLSCHRTVLRTRWAASRTLRGKWEMSPVNLSQYQHVCLLLSKLSLCHHREHLSKTWPACGPLSCTTGFSVAPCCGQRPYLHGLGARTAFLKTGLLATG